MSVMRNKDIVDIVTESRNTGLTPNFTIYDDNCWWIEIEYRGNVRFWVGYEDKKTGRVNSSLCTVYPHLSPIDCAADFRMKNSIKEKVLSAWQALYEAGLV